MSKLHPVEVMRQALYLQAEMERIPKRFRRGALSRIDERLSGFTHGYANAMCRYNHLFPSATPKAYQQGYLAGRRAAIRWLEKCPVVRLTAEPGEEMALYRLERIGD